ncbi:MAG: PilZ domain-containing protein [Acidobacteriia bacterium]|nr:PilZ domain-containing protein [Terriglobia bacterium]
MSPSTPSIEKNARKSIRMTLKFPMTILGRDQNGKEYALVVETIDVSPHGFCIELPRDCAASGDDVFISIATKFNARARIRWLDKASKSSESVRCGIELVEPYNNWVLTE